MKRATIIDRMVSPKTTDAISQILWQSLAEREDLTGAVRLEIAMLAGGLKAAADTSRENDVPFHIVGQLEMEGEAA